MFCQLLCKHQDGQLALVVGQSHVITFLCIQVTEVDLTCSVDYTGDVDDSTRGGLDHQIQQGHGQKNRTWNSHQSQRSLWAFYLGHNSLWDLNYWVFILEDSCTINQLFLVCEKFSRSFRKPHCHNFFLLQASFLKPVV